MSRERILDATLAIATERGYDGTKVSMVTEHTGLPASSIYWHFANKDELLAETLEHSYRRWREVGSPWGLDVASADLHEEVRARLARAAASLTASPEFWSLGLMLVLQQRVNEPSARRRYVDIRRQTEDEIAAWWARVLPADLMRRDEQLPVRLARFHLLCMDGLLMAVRAGEIADPEAAVDDLAVGLTGYLSSVSARGAA